MELPSLHSVLLLKLPSTDLQNVVSTFTLFHRALLLVEELPSQQLKCGNGSMLMDLLVLPCSPPSWSGWLDRLVGSPLENSVTVPARWQCLAGLGQVSPGCSICSESASNKWGFFSHSQDRWVQESRGHLLTNTLTDALANSVLPVPTILWIPRS